jgi:hypothetical protein
MLHTFKYVTTHFVSELKLKLPSITRSYYAIGIQIFNARYWIQESAIVSPSIYGVRVSHREKKDSFKHINISRYSTFSQYF